MKNLRTKSTEYFGQWCRIWSEKRKAKKERCNEKAISVILCGNWKVTVSNCFKYFCKVNDIYSKMSDYKFYTCITNNSGQIIMGMRLLLLMNGRANWVHTVHRDEKKEEQNE